MIRKNFIFVVFKTLLIKVDSDNTISFQFRIIYMYFMILCFLQKRKNVALYTNYTT